MNLLLGALMVGLGFINLFWIIRGIVNGEFSYVLMANLFAFGFCCAVGIGRILNKGGI